MVRLVFAGTPEPAVPALTALLGSRHDVVAVLTRPAKAAGRGRTERRSPVEELARDVGVPVLTPDRPSDVEFQAQLTELAPDCCPVVAYGALLPLSALRIPRQGWVNLHFSLLPAWRGAAPVQHSILHGDDVTGASTFQIEAGLDTGPVFGVVTETIRPWDTSGDLLDRLAVSGAALLLATMDGIEDGSLVARPQSSDGASIAGKISVADARVDWKAPAVHVDRLIRACTPAPGAWAEFRGERIKLSPIRVREGRLEPGQLRVRKSAIFVGTATDVVELGTVQPAAKRPMPASDWARGARVVDGDHLE
jgi:methionyl-tRNA formyltransferase